MITNYYLHECINSVFIIMFKQIRDANSIQSFHIILQDYNKQVETDH